MVEITQEEEHRCVRKEKRVEDTKWVEGVRGEEEKGSMMKEKEHRGENQKRAGAL